MGREIHAWMLGSGQGTGREDPPELLPAWKEEELLRVLRQKGSKSIRGSTETLNRFSATADCGAWHGRQELG